MDTGGNLGGMSTEGFDYIVKEKDAERVAKNIAEALNIF
jgi:hypothetical protein